jgi:predicted NodU family carbamoyl transferase
MPGKPMNPPDERIREALEAWLQARTEFDPHARVLEEALARYFQNQGPLPYPEMEAAEKSRIGVAQSFHALCDAIRTRGGP